MAGVPQVNAAFDSSAEQAPALTPADHARMLRERVERDSRDGDAWLGLIEDAAARADLDALRKTYEEFFVIFPNAARQWQDYASVELSHSEFANVESIFTRCLRTTPSTDLWQFYLSYTRRVNPLPPSAGQKAANEAESEREKVRKVIEGAYEFALRFIGQSRDSGEVWRDYINLLKERETSNQWQAGQKMDDIRRAYQRAVAVPLAIVEQIWREYDAYENGLNRITAKKFLADRSPAYMTARSVFREMRTLTDGLYRPQLPRVPCWATPPSLEAVVSPLTVVRDRHNIELWKKYLRWEESNPSQLEDVQALQARVLLAYRKSVMHMRFYPELWYMASIYLQKCDREEEAVTWLRNGMEACAGSSLLSFAFVEQAERHSQTQGCNEIFDQLLNWIHTEIEKLNEQLEAKIKTIDEEAEREKAEVAARKRDEGAADAIEGEEREELRKMEERREERRSGERERIRPKIEEMKEYASLVWIKHMHFARRSEGQKPSRTIFARARKSKYCTWQIFEANALMEYHTNKDVTVATKVFELALKTYGSDEAFVVRYLDFLLAINDDNNARALFERTVGNFTPDRARPIWDRWSQYEYSFGDSASIAKVEERLSQVYPEENATKRLMNRNTYMDLDIVGPRDLGVRRLAGSAGGGASAAERATIASRELAQEMEGTSVIGAPTGPRADALHSIAEEPMMKRPRLNSTTPPPSTHYRGGVSGAPLGPRGPQYLELPDGVMYLLDALPNASFFDGPLFPAESIIDSLLNANVPAATDFFAKQRNGPMQNAGGRGGRRGGPGRGGRRF
ncbi:Suf-domain-containing protein [Meira miltonrushii]|uniref:mRNA 3'-end-processing protein RNA14 n=1 Tax=Meira miltonrushii TaxID=1280837 RepID=A0A316V4M0_9BASI|nr:Suf-domain-containing protein [Meira miltonrushii]PWN32470.1 Suf-domain-containing protein [Meira miltonrushii]